MKSFALCVCLMLAPACSSRTAAEPPAPHARAHGASQPLTAAAATPDASPSLDLTRLRAQHAPAFSSELGYDPTKAGRLSQLQDSSMQLNTAELERLRKHGFALSARQRFPSFTYGYATIYAADLPVFISADSLLDALHRSYDQILIDCETQFLRQELSSLLSGLRAALARSPQSGAHEDLALYLGVAHVLLDPRAAGALPAAATDILKRVQDASGMGALRIFGTERQEDFSQFTPRGHYKDDPDLERYFRAMMWLGRVDFRLVEQAADHPVLQRRQLAAMLLLDSLLDAPLREQLGRIEQLLTLLVGPGDALTPGQLPELYRAAGVLSPRALNQLDDATILRLLRDRGFGQQRIMGQLVLEGMRAPVSFGILPQRYTPDADVLSSVTWNRTRSKRMLPDPLDAAYAALANDQALNLLGPSLATYAGELQAVRERMDAHSAAFWQSSMYGSWLRALRALSPSNASLTAQPRQLPSVARTQAWGRRLLGTQLASWAQLRHDTLLYAKQSYTTEALCEFPDVAVDPYPAFYAQLERFASHGQQLSAAVERRSASLASALRGYFAHLSNVAQQLRGIADAQLAHTPLTAAQLRFVNDAVVIRSRDGGCTTIEVPSGWYPRLIYGADPLEFDPTIADVHTQPTDETGQPVGRILHVATGSPRVLVVTLEGCDGKPRAYVGLASSYYELVTQDMRRLDDSEWSQSVHSPPAEPRWLADLVQSE